MEDDAEGFGLELRDGGEGELRVDVLKEERGEEELGARRESGALDVVEENVAVEIVSREAIAKAREKIGIDVGIGEAVRAENFGIEEVEKLASAGSSDGDAGGGGELGGVDQASGERGGGLRLADGGHVGVVIVGSDDLGPGAAEGGIHGRSMAKATGAAKAKPLRDCAS